MSSSTNTTCSATRAHIVWSDRPASDRCRWCGEPRSPPRPRWLTPAVCANTAYRVSLHSPRRVRPAYTCMSRSLKMEQEVREDRH
jgi:hypothetical protein